MATGSVTLPLSISLPMELITDPIESVDYPGSPRDDFGEKPRLLELPSISEENEDTIRSRHSSVHGSERHPLDFGVPEPDHIAPGSYSHLPKDFEELSSPPQVVHR